MGHIFEYVLRPIVVVHAIPRGVIQYSVFRLACPSRPAAACTVFQVLGNRNLYLIDPF
jgi:hypothetical protein